jgi:hypothetical protein
MQAGKIKAVDIKALNTNSANIKAKKQYTQPL